MASSFLTRCLKSAVYQDKINSIVHDITQQLSDFRLGMAAETVYNEFWHWFCDVAIEEAKEGKISQAELMYGLEVFLKLLHPFMPFVTEAVWHEMGKTTLLISENWPE